ncbi:MAG: phosphoribosylanthranilate isomerase [Gammaproteobacteria bacterium]|nr:phosphoribosylanthranilate isomerase [Gammaproteobacteria bacterium]
MTDIWIKICGITRAEDARAAIDLGADAIGIVCFPPSARHVPRPRFGEVLERVGDEVEVYALFVNPEPAEVTATVATGLFSGLQFHGDESAGFCESFGLPYMKALRVRGDSNLRQQIEGFDSARRVLLDTFDESDESSYGGTGKSFRWEIAADLVAAGAGNIVVAGGLHDCNVAAAIRQARPSGVDVSSGVEAEPGVKDPNKLRAFMREARSA